MPAAPVFIDGQKALTLRGPKIAEDFQLLVADYIEKRFGHGQAAAE
jgi:(E)-4-hydroxy-3-methylbut-2-enyl-diphosphate synthase